MEQMAEAGRTLQEARQRGGRSLAEVSAETGIAVHFLEAIEAGRFEALPAAVYVRGFVRIYARTLGLDPEAVVQQLGPRWAPAGAGQPGHAEATLARAEFVAPASPPSRQPPEPEPPPVARDEPPRRPPQPRASTEEAGLLRPAPARRPPSDGWAVDEPIIGAAVATARAPADRPPPPLIIDDLQPVEPPAESAALGHRRLSRTHLGQGRLPVFLAAAAVVVALGALAAFVLAGGGDSGNAGADAGSTATASATATGGPAFIPPASAAATETVEPTGTPTPTPAPSPTPTPTPTPTRTPTPAPPTPTPAPVAVVMPAVPSDAFAYCKSLGGDVYDCGPAPWRVICTPSGRFLDFAGIVPRPIPPEWTGWRETSISGRLENLFNAC